MSKSTQFMNDDFGKEAKKFLGADAQTMSKAIDAQPAIDSSQHVDHRIEDASPKSEKKLTPEQHAEQIKKKDPFQKKGVVNHSATQEDDWSPEAREAAAQAKVRAASTPEAQAENYARSRAKRESERKAKSPGHSRRLGEHTTHVVSE
jgi:hypothetical protein